MERDLADVASVESSFLSTQEKKMASKCIMAAHSTLQYKVSEQQNVHEEVDMDTCNITTPKQAKMGQSRIKTGKRTQMLSRLQI